MNKNLIELKSQLLGSLLLFTQTFYKIRMGRDFSISNPIGRQSHNVEICRALVKVFHGENNRLIINIPPRYGKTEHLIHFVAWAIAHNPSSNFLYVSYSEDVAKTQTQIIKEIISTSHFQKLFDTKIKRDLREKKHFETIQGGKIYAAGSEGGITGRGAGIFGNDDFGGCIVIDDIHKPDEAQNDNSRNKIHNWYQNTLMSRLNSAKKTPIIFIGQRVHEDDQASKLIKTGDWDTLILPALDEANNPLDPDRQDLEMLLKDKEFSPYVFAAQYQQNPIPPSGGIFKSEWFKILTEEPKIISTFITCDSAETTKQYNDATVFSFWGIYKINMFGVETDLYGIHWIDCEEIRVEPKDLEYEFSQFYYGCMRYKIPPAFSAIEKKSTGVTLCSILKSYQGIRIIELERTSKSGSKSDRFLSLQPFVANGQISLPEYGAHTKMCIDHCSKITANNAHRFDDIADTLYDAVKIALIDKILINILSTKKDCAGDKVLKNMNLNQNRMNQFRGIKKWQT